MIPQDAIGLGVALGIGLLIGLERERAKRPGTTRAAAGVRTFSLLGLTGATATLIGPEGIYVAGFFAAMTAAARYRATSRGDPGMTTEAAMLATLLLGMLAIRSPALAGGAGVVVATVLANRRRLHRLSRQWLSERELHDLLTLAAAAFVVMPLLPDRAIDPWGAIHPRSLWMLVVIVMAIGSFGYISLRAFGMRFGMAVAGLAGGFASSTATVALMGERARATPRMTASAASAALMSNIATIVQLAVVTGTLSRPLLSQLALPLLAAGTVAVIAALAVSWNVLRARDATPMPGEDRPFELGTALRFAALLGLVLWVTAVARATWGEASVPWMAAISGAVDVHAAAASVAQSVAAGRMPAADAATAVVTALAANSLLKCVFAAWRGGLAFALRVVPGIVAIVAAFAVVAWSMPWSRWQ
ncbi:DUF4010 domain-containing protein [Luteibacter aegosomatis]|uniref:MgtC/SapB family protein n=1 Tax=Luteibacter aegosomatis TaxID=2911537 RepID=UPI001FF79CF5|nr:DUF4010 domain-containing protein [Luteibacter aegosomatis]UPG86675.1 DUF4010 domain-containing protein [Luteibacter aegosomatis]